MNGINSIRGCKTRNNLSPNLISSGNIGWDFIHALRLTPSERIFTSDKWRFGFELGRDSGAVRVLHFDARCTVPNSPVITHETSPFSFRCKMQPPVNYLRIPPVLSFMDFESWVWVYLNNKSVASTFVPAFFAGTPIELELGKDFYGLQFVKRDPQNDNVRLYEAWASDAFIDAHTMVPGFETKFGHAQVGADSFVLLDSCEGDLPKVFNYNALRNVDQQGAFLVLELDDSVAPQRCSHIVLKFYSPEEAAKYAGQFRDKDAKWFDTDGNVFWYAQFLQKDEEDVLKPSFMISGHPLSLGEFKMLSVFPEMKLDAVLNHVKSHSDE